jgi:hypothetical protein
MEQPALPSPLGWMLRDQFRRQVEVELVEPHGPTL